MQIILLLYFFINLRKDFGAIYWQNYKLHFQPFIWKVDHFQVFLPMFRPARKVPLLSCFYKTLLNLSTKLQICFIFQKFIGLCLKSSYPTDPRAAVANPGAVPPSIWNAPRLKIADRKSLVVIIKRFFWPADPPKNICCI